MGRKRKRKKGRRKRSELALRWARRKENRRHMLEHLLKNPCIDCGEKDILVLEFDHVDRKRKRATVTRLLHLPLETVKKEIEKCAVRCCNCHRRRTARQMGWKTRLALSAKQKGD